MAKMLYMVLGLPCLVTYVACARVRLTAVDSGNSESRRLLQDGAGWHAELIPRVQRTIQRWDGSWAAKDAGDLRYLASYLKDVLSDSYSQRSWGAFVIAIGNGVGSDIAISPSCGWPEININACGEQGAVKQDRFKMDNAGYVSWAIFWESHSGLKYPQEVRRAAEGVIQDCQQTHPGLAGLAGCARDRLGARAVLLAVDGGDPGLLGVAARVDPFLGFDSGYGTNRQYNAWMVVAPTWF